MLADDADALMLVPGIGKKTATRLLVELKTRLDVDLDGADVHLVETPIRGRTAPGAGGRGGGHPGRGARRPLRARATGPTRSATPSPRLPPDGALEDQIRLALPELAGAR